MVKSAKGMREVLLARRLREALVALELCNKMIDDEAAEDEGHQPLLTTTELELMSLVVRKVDDMVAGYEDQLPQPSNDGE